MSQRKRESSTALDAKEYRHIRVLFINICIHRPCFKLRLDIGLVC